MTLSHHLASTRSHGRKLILVLAAIMTIGVAHAGTGGEESRNAELVRAAFTAWERGEGAVFDLLAPDIAWTIHGSGPVAGTYHGVDAFLERASAPLVSRLATPLVPRVHHIWADGERVIVRFDASATTTSGAPYENRFVWIFRLEDDAVVEAEAFLDLVAYQQVVENNEPAN